MSNREYSNSLAVNGTIQSAVPLQSVATNRGGEAGHFSCETLTIRNGNEIRILTHNVGQHLARFDVLDHLIATSNADVVFLQELPTAYATAHLPYLREHYPYQIYTPSRASESAGMAIVSRHRMSDVAELQLAPEGLVYQQRVRLYFNGHSILAYNIHLTFPWFRPSPLPFWPWVLIPSYDHRIRTQEVHALARLLQEDSGPTILAGDFNLTRGSNDYCMLGEHLSDAWIDTKHKCRTWPVNRTPTLFLPVTVPCIGLDYVFVPDAWSVTKTRIMDRTGSDHLPVLVEAVICHTEHQEIGGNECRGAK